MALAYSKPSGALAGELSEVATAAKELFKALNERSNVPLPIDFPKDQLANICQSLTQLPLGTAEGCKAPLDYARERLPRIRRQHIRIDTNTVADTATMLTRGTQVDVKLGVLISAVSTAWDEYKRAAAEEHEIEVAPEMGVAVGKGIAEELATQSRTLDEATERAQSDVKDKSVSGSKRADDLLRQFEDVRSVSRMSVAEAQMPSSFGSLLRKPTNALRISSSVIRGTVDKISRGVDIVHIHWQWWHHYKTEQVELLFKHIKSLLALQEATIEIIERPTAQGGLPKFATLLEACLFILKRKGAAMPPVAILAELQQLPGAQHLVDALPKTKPSGRIAHALSEYRDRGGDIANIGAGHWTTELSKGDLTKARKLRENAIASAGDQSHSAKTKRGMDNAKLEGRRLGRSPTLTDTNIAEAITLLEEGHPVAAVSEKFGVSTTTLRERIYSKTGKRFWKKGPRSKE